MKTIFFLISILFLTSDSISNKNEVEFILKNEAVYFVDIDRDFENYVDTIQSDKAFNLIELQIKNNSNRKLLLFINPNNLTLYRGKYFGYGPIIKNGKERLKVSSVLSTFIDTPEGLYNQEQYETDLRNRKYKSLGLTEKEMGTYNDYENYSMNLGPKESKTVYFSISLPIIKESEPKIDQSYVRFRKLEEGLNFKFCYEANANAIYNDLPQFLKEELKNNDVQILDGLFFSNIVKLKKRS